MSIDAEKIKSLVSFKQKLEKRVEELESELKELQDTLGAVNSILLEKGFKRAEITEKRHRLQKKKSSSNMNHLSFNFQQNTRALHR